MCSLAVGWLTRSLRAIRQPQTPSFTKSPSTCGGKCFVGFLSHSRICSLRSLPRARVATVDIMTFSTLPNHHSTLRRDSRWLKARRTLHVSLSSWLCSEAVHGVQVHRHGLYILNLAS